MAAIYLIRHGQASFGKADYDQLSDKGKQQSQLLGKHWQSRPDSDKFYSGDLLRHRQTLTHFLLGAQSKDKSVKYHAGFNEFNHIELLTCCNPKWQNFVDLQSSIDQQTTIRQINKTFKKEFTRAFERWVCGKYDSDYKESWQQFKMRCVRALHDVINQELNGSNSIDKNQASKTVFIFTSGGVIAVIIQYILGLTDEKTLAINQQTRNTSVTKIHYSQNNLNVDYFNNYNHLTLAGEGWVTFV